LHISDHPLRGFVASTMATVWSLFKAYLRLTASWFNRRIAPNDSFRPRQVQLRLFGAKLSVTVAVACKNMGN
jgi:hypothetical protein